VNGKRRLLVFVLLSAGVLTAWTLWSVREPPRRDNGTTPPVASDSGARTAAQPNPDATGSQSVDVHASASELPISDDEAVQRRIPRALNERLDNFVRDFARLQAEAEAGSIEAMKSLYKGLHPCRHQPTSQVEIDEIIAMDEGEGEIDPRRVQASRAFMERVASRCRSLGPDIEAQQYKWLRAAAGLGDRDARLDYVRLGSPSGPIRPGYAERRLEYRRLAEEYLQQEIAAGNAEALLVASDSYGSARLRRPNPMEQYAYLYAYSLADADAVLMPYVYRSLAEMRAQMNESVLSQASALGEQIYSNCCAPRG
jgi:hypothetical protein